MGVDEKRELVRRLLKCKLIAPEQLQEWTHRVITEVLCAELGRKGKKKTFSSMPKHRMLDLLFEVMNGESSYPFKRQRKNGSSSLPASNGLSALMDDAHLCQNSACRATIHSGDKFCKCCSCCICFKYDDNKDPTLWLYCNSDHPLQEDSCGFSCHLECAIEDE